jgi:2,3-bisphosphoglycerate-independent phosphoglycerate mutase
MDGVGLSPRVEGNAIIASHSETLKNLLSNYPMVPLGASGHYVGIPDGDMGNSEVGHNAMGAGRVIKQIILKVEDDFATGEIFKYQTWQDAIANVKQYNSTLHFSGIMSDGNVHGNIHHLEKMLAEAHREGITRVRIHPIIDGRDVPPQSEPKYINELEDFIKSLGEPDYKIASGGGRMVIVADRYGNDWGMVEKGWHAIVLGDARPFRSAAEAVETFRHENPSVQDQYLPPFTIVDENNAPVGTVNDGDSFIYTDFRADRAVEIAMAFTYDDFPYFDRVRRPNVYFAGMTEYNSDTHVPAHTLVPPIKIDHTLSEYLSSLNISEYAISETVKYGHITYYFNGNRYDKFNDALETYIEIPSYVDGFDTRPWLKSAEIEDAFTDAIESKKYGFLRVNFPNGDMVGHYGEMEPSIVAIESVDIQLKRILAAADATNSVVIITADHGNIEETLDENGQPKTSHTTNPVPCIFYNLPKNYVVEQGDFGLTNLAATIATLLGVKPLDLWDSSLIKATS